MYHPIWSPAGFSAALFVFGIGSLVRPTALGALAGSFGLRAAFLASAAGALLTVLARLEEPKGEI